MASYDASIRVSTRVDTDQLKEAQKEFDRLNKKLESLYAKGEKLEALGVDKQSKQWKSLRYDVAQTEVALGDASDRLKELNNLNSDNIGKGFQTASDAGKKFNSVIHTGTKKSNGLMKTLASRLKGITLSLFVFQWITKGFNAMISAMKSGFQNLAKYSNDYNASMSALKSECAQLKNGLAAAFEPVANIVIPYITKMVGWINTAADTMARFFAALSGKSTYTKAKKQVIDYAKSLDTASNSAKGALASFDSINVLTSNETAGGASGESTGTDAFETADVGTDMQEIVNSIQPFKEMIDSWLQNLDFTNIIQSFNNLKTACEPFGGYIVSGLAFFLENILLPLGSWTITDLLPAFFNLLAAALDALNIVWVITQPYLAWLWDNFLAPAASWVGDAVVNGINFITEALKGFSDWATANENNMNMIRAIILGFFAGIITYYTVKKIVTVIGAIKTALTAFSSASLITAGNVILAVAAIAAMAAGIIYLAANWDKLSGAQKAITILGALAAAAIACAVAVAIFHTAWSVGIAAAAIVGGLALLGLTAACLNWNGESTSPSMADAASFANSTSSSPLPALATGGITTRPTTALIGEAGKEAVLPLENNTEWMDVLADRIGQNVTIKFTGSLSELGRVLKPVIDTENARVGKSFRK